MKIAFITEAFPLVSQTFIINQVADLKDRGVDVQVFSFKKGDNENLAENFRKYRMGDLTHYMGMPKGKLSRFVRFAAIAFRLMKKKPIVLFRSLNFKRYGRNALSLRTVYLADFFMDRNFDLAHCHFGPVANDFVLAKEILGLKQKFITTFYGYDASRVFKIESKKYYDRIKKECSLFFAMSHDMKNRLIQNGFDGGKIRVHPPGVDIGNYKYLERKPGENINLLSVGRLVEKKGMDDLLRAINVVRQKTDKTIRCTIVGDGPLKNELLKLRNLLDLNDIVGFRGYMSMEEINDLLLGTHIYVQPSKTDSRGNME